MCGNNVINILFFSKRIIYYSNFKRNKLSFKVFINRDTLQVYYSRVMTLICKEDSEWKLQSLAMLSVKRIMAPPSLV